MSLGCPTVPESKKALPELKAGGTSTGRKNQPERAHNGQSQNFSKKIIIINKRVLTCNPRYEINIYNSVPIEISK